MRKEGYEKNTSKFLMDDKDIRVWPKAPPKAEEPEVPSIVEQPEKSVESEEAEELKYSIGELVTIATIDISVTYFQRSD